MSKVYTSFKEVSRAYKKVRGELAALGLLRGGSKLDGVECLFDSFPVECVWRGAEGLWKEGLNAIVFPRFYFAGGEKDSDVDVLRHEFGHALADLYPGALKKGGVFRAAFGGAYGEAPAEECVADGWGDRYVSEYATSMTQEDFAETFMLFVKHKGKIPAKFAKKPAIRKKWKAVAEIVKRVAAGPR